MSLLSPDFLKALIPALVLGGCAVFERGAPPEEPEPAGQTPLSPAQWMEIDAVVAVDNMALAAQIRTAVLETPLPPGLVFEAVRVDTHEGAMRLTVEGQIERADMALEPVTLEGEVVFSYAGTGLSWHPRFDHISDQGIGGEADTRAWVRRVNDALSRHLVSERRNELGLRLQPPGAIKLGARLPGLGLAPASGRFELDGAYNVAASLVRVDASRTLFALDLEFVDGLRHCESDFSIARATFAGDIRDREPREIAARVPANATQWHYFTEVTDARRKLTLVHYWFADGRPVGITELPVEPSARWRTWSTLPVVPGTVRHIEVFAADRDAACIVSGAHIEVAPGAAFPAARFDNATRQFHATLGETEIASAEFGLSALAETINDALAGGRFALRFDQEVAIDRPLSGKLEVHENAVLECIRPNCSVQTECPVDFSRCQRMQDTRECTTCLFRNPLNNRCMSERVDEECEARKAGLNARYGRDWEACMAREEAAQAACERHSQEAEEVCEQRAERFSRTCEANQAALQGRDGPIADIAGEGRAEGHLSVAFSELEVSGDLNALKGLVTVAPDLDVEGSLNFTPGAGLGALGSCIEQWNATFQTRFDRPQAPRRLAGPMRFSNGVLDAAWPAMTIPIAMTRGPVEAFLINETWRLSTCMPGLTAAEVGAQVSGDEGLFLRGIVPVDIDQGAASIALPGFSARFGGAERKTQAAREGQRVRYSIEVHQE